MLEEYFPFQRSTDFFLAVQSADQLHFCERLVSSVRMQDLDENSRPKTFWHNQKKDAIRFPGEMPTPRSWVGESVAADWPGKNDAVKILPLSNTLTD